MLESLDEFGQSCENCKPHSNFPENLQHKLTKNILQRNMSNCRQRRCQCLLASNLRKCNCQGTVSLFHKLVSAPYTTIKKKRKKSENKKPHIPPKSMQKSVNFCQKTHYPLISQKLIYYEMPRKIERSIISFIPLHYNMRQVKHIRKNPLYEHQSIQSNQIFSFGHIKFQGDQHQIK